MSRPPSRKTLPPSTADADLRSVLDSIRRIVRVLRLASREAEKRVGLSAAQLFVLQKLVDERALSVNELADRTHTHQSSVSVVVQRLVDGGMVSRKRSKKDARQMELSVTAAGKKILALAPEAEQDRIIAALRKMPVSGVRRLSLSLHALLDLLGVDPAEPVSMLFEDEGSHARKRS